MRLRKLVDALTYAALLPVAAPALLMYRYLPGKRGDTFRRRVDELVADADHAARASGED